MDANLAAFAAVRQAWRADPVLAVRRLWNAELPDDQAAALRLAAGDDDGEAVIDGAARLELLARLLVHRVLLGAPPTRVLYAGAAPALWAALAGAVGRMPAWPAARLVIRPARLELEGLALQVSAQAVRPEVLAQTDAAPGLLAIDDQAVGSGPVVLIRRGHLLRLAPAKRVDAERTAAADRAGLAERLGTFLAGAWGVLEPSRAFQANWHLDAIAEHLEAVTRREITRLLINVPFRTLKSTLVSVAWPSWEWTHRPSSQLLGLSHAEKLAVRDLRRSRTLIESAWYRERWPDVALTLEQAGRIENAWGGIRIAAGFGSGITGEGGDTVLIDDPHDRDQAHSKAEREAALVTFDEKVSTRLNDPATGAIVVIMQRLHEQDLAGHLLAQGGWEHLMLPMRFEPMRRSTTVLGFTDPREEDGELLHPARFPADAVAKLERQLGSYGTAGQLQQRPAPEGGGILKRDWWRLYEPDVWPDALFAFLSVDCAYGASDDADHSACTAWIIYEDAQLRLRLLLVAAWRENLEFNALVEKLIETARRVGADKLVVEAKASGLSVIQEIRRRAPGLSVEARQPAPGDKIARAYAVQGVLEAGHVEAPDRKWADLVIDECASFPSGRFKDLVDTVTQAIDYTRRRGLALFDDEQPDPWAAVASAARQPLY